MSWRDALVQTVGMFAVMVFGWAGRRWALLPGPAVIAFSRFVVDVALPALILEQMLEVAPADLLAGWSVPLWAVAFTALAYALGALTAPLFAPRGSGRTYVFLAGTANWIYLPLPIAGALFGEQGRLVVLLYNVGGLLMLWSAGVWVLRGRADRHAALELARNPGLLATAAGVALALLHVGDAAALHPGLAIAGGAFRAMLHLLASLTVPLSLLFIGAQLGPAPGGSSESRRAVVGVSIVRLVLAPAATLALLLAARRAGSQSTLASDVTLTIITGMPPAVSCGVLAERFGGDAGLASRAIFYATLVGVLATPALVWVAGQVLGAR